MSANRLFTVLIILSLVAVTFFTIRNVAPTTALASADHSYDQVEQVRAVRSGVNLQVDRSYDVIEALRVQKEANNVVADHSYDLLEGLRVTRALP